ncbi:TetR/AcrR family transcriptional regulator [Nocardia sp. NBC_00565]|uniref:TetR/AcrR family transcriptional regulator n=1 Tax=Nocardia sp. NBC_00565 TaxID=2975993 RepID=UPI002E819D65|nr:TetR family transcriptional regulator [Nocardia sp. NBC_00565]WUC07916.1 TetR/AcrR family transcriptional regulator [Nocardia sp. NBC_00565]
MTARQPDMDGGDTAPATPVRGHRPGPGRPRLSERRRRATQLEIAYEAVRLFTRKGVAATSADEIADAAGMSTRSLWRYFPTKEQCVRPLLTAGIEELVTQLREWPTDRPLLEAMNAGPTRTFSVPDGQESLRGLIRLTRTEPGLRAVWLQGNDEATRELIQILASRTGQDPESLPMVVQGTVLNAALTGAVEYWAWNESEVAGHSFDGAIREALRIVASALPDNAA